MEYNKSQLVTYMKAIMEYCKDEEITLDEAMQNDEDIDNIYYQFVSMQELEAQK